MIAWIGEKAPAINLGSHSKVFAERSLGFRKGSKL
jgi:hypothetical protein